MSQVSRFKQIVRFSNVMRIASIGLIIALCIAYVTPLIHPENLWVLPFFGLAYPVLVFLTFITIIYWLLLRSYKWCIALLLTLAVGYVYTMRLVAFGEVTETPGNAQTSIKVLSNNVQIFDLYEENPKQKFATRDSIFQYAITEEADVVCFQEFYNKDNPTTFPTADLFRKEFNAADYHQRYIYKKVGRQHFGVALFSRLPVIAKGDVIFELEDESNYNFCIYVDVVKNNDTFRVYNVHLQSFRISKIQDEKVKPEVVKGVVKKLKTAYPKRANQALRINEHIQNSPYPVIVCGDFNDTPVSFVYNQFQNHLTDAFLNCGSGIGSTYVGKLPAGRIDYIFHSPELISTNFVVQKKPFSDHRAISCVVSKVK
jgi:endonuclease/exonuclease/phosphatase family metal-dependent hydrolase